MEGFGCGLDEEHVWTPESCSHEVIVYSDGKVSSNYTSRTRQNKFFVPWKSGFPVKTGSACPSGCRVHDDGCSCSMTVQARSVFSTLPSGSELSQLKIGAVKPAGQCTQCSGPVRAYGAMDDPDTVFEHQGKFYKILGGSPPHASSKSGAPPKNERGPFGFPSQPQHPPRKKEKAQPENVPL